MTAPTFTTHDCDDADPWTPEGFECWLWSALTGPDQLPHDDSPLLVSADWFTDDDADNAARAEALAEDVDRGKRANAGNPDAVNPDPTGQASSLATFLRWVAAADVNA